MSEAKPLNSAMDNVDAMCLGQICAAVYREPAGDLIDEGLILCRLLDEAGYSLIKTPTP